LAIAPALAQTGKATKKGVTAAAAASAAPAASAGVSAPVASAAPATSAAPPAVAGPSVATPRPASSGIDGATYAVRLKDLEQRIDELKEQIRRSHTRLSLLTDTILSGGLAGSRAEIEFHNDLSSAFRLVRALFVLDGAVQYNKSDDTGALAEQTVIPIFSGSIPPGDHTLQVLLNLQGNGYGVFSYLKSYHFEPRSSHSFTAVEGKTMSLQVIAYEKGGVTTQLEDRLAVRYQEKISAGVTGTGNGPAKPAAPATPSGAPGSASISTGLSVGTGGK
jgi:hypothetical protein